uniref:amidase family protein n=1 Tax=uncultured Nocardioides sp. TaxID=198441 RepID=UPI00261ADC32
MSFTPPTPIDAALPLTERIRRAYERIADVDRPEVWITLRTQQDALADALEIDRRYEAGEQLPLRGVLVAVKDNIDVAGLPTTAGCPEYARVAERSAVAVQRLTAAGAIILGKTNVPIYATDLQSYNKLFGVTN